MLRSSFASYFASIFLTRKIQLKYFSKIERNFKHLRAHILAKMQEKQNI